MPRSGRRQGHGRGATDVARLVQVGPVPELDALAAMTDERDFEAVAKAVREAIERNEPEPASTACTPS